MKTGSSISVFVADFESNKTLARVVCVFFFLHDSHLWFLGWIKLVITRSLHGIRKDVLWCAFSLIGLFMLLFDWLKRRALIGKRERKSFECLVVLMKSCSSCSFCVSTSKAVIDFHAVLMQNNVYSLCCTELKNCHKFWKKNPSTWIRRSFKRRKKKAFTEGCFCTVLTAQSWCSSFRASFSSVSFPSLAAATTFLFKDNLNKSVCSQKPEWVWRCSSTWSSSVRLDSLQLTFWVVNDCMMMAMRALQAWPLVVGKTNLTTPSAILLDDEDLQPSFLPLEAFCCYFCAILGESLIVVPHL